MRLLALAVAWLPGRVSAAVLCQSKAHHLSICVAYKSAMSQWLQLFRAIEAHREVPLPVEPHAKELASGAWPRGCIFGWQPFYDGAASPPWVHVHVLREPTERLVSGYLNRCVALGACGRPARNWTATTSDLLDFVATSLAQNLHDHHFEAQMTACAAHSRPQLATQRPAGAFDRTVAWTGTELGPALLPICLERNVSTQLCEASFPHTSNAAHTTGAAAYLATMPPAERAVLREAVFRLYPRDVATYQRYRRDQRDDPARSKDQSE